MEKRGASGSAEPPGETTHWTGRATAAATDISLRSVRGSGQRTAAAVQAVAPMRSTFFAALTRRHLQRWWVK